MTIGERIKTRREALNLSQDELARKLGYKDRSSITKIEKSNQNLTQTKIKAIADALETTPAYIMGWEEYALNELNKMSAKDIRRDEISHSDFMDKLLMLDYTDFAKIEERIDMLLESDKYKKDATFTSAKAI